MSTSALPAIHTVVRSGFHPGQSVSSESSTHSGLLRREQLFGAIRLARVLDQIEWWGHGAVVDFPTSIVVDTQVFDLEITARPGVFPEGHHSITVRGLIGDHDLTGRFEINVGPGFGVAPAAWVVQDLRTGQYVDVPAAWRDQLPRSVETPVQHVIGAMRRTQLAAERARAELIEANRGLLVTVVKRFRGVSRTEGSIIEPGDLMVVAEQQLLEVADRWFTDPEQPPTRDVAWSKLVQRAVGNAIRSEIARATGISVEFRHLLGWFHTHADDRRLSAEAIAQRMAMHAGATRLMATHGLRSRAQAALLLEGMLERGEAQYVAPGRDAASISKRLREEGVFVVSSRSSIAEIERARHFRGAASITLDGDDDQPRADLTAVHDRGHEHTETLDAVRSVIVATGMTEIEALVWVLRTGVLDPTGQASELPDIATELSLSGRDEARAALRRARRKLENWAGTDPEISFEAVLETVGSSPTRPTPGKDVRCNTTRR
jgi:hypothetical protein